MGPGDRAVSLGRPKQPDFTGQSARARRCRGASGRLSKARCGLGARTMPCEATCSRGRGWKGHSPPDPLFPSQLTYQLRPRLLPRGALLAGLLPSGKKEGSRNGDEAVLLTARSSERFSPASGMILRTESGPSLHSSTCFPK